MVFGGTQHPAVSPASDKGTLRLPTVALAYASAPCGFRSPSSLHASLFHSATLHYIGLHSAYFGAPLLGADFRFICSASASLLPDFKGFHFHFRGLVPPLRSAHAPTGIPSAHTRSPSTAFPSPSSLALTGALTTHTIPEVHALPYAFHSYSASLHINSAYHLSVKTPPHTLAHSNLFAFPRGCFVSLRFHFVSFVFTVCSPQFSANLAVSAH